MVLLWEEVEQSLEGSDSLPLLDNLEKEKQKIF